jgi:16S rRNA (guanine966-N2)-methyltransferase
MQKNKPAKVPVHGPQHNRQVRIIGGEWKRTPLPVLEALGLRGDWGNLRVLDLFAGSGALGYEAASRGAQHVTMADANAAIVRQLQAVQEKLKATNVTVLRADALALAQSLAGRGQQFDVIFLDPPYGLDLLPRALPLCEKLVAEGGLVYAESGEPLPAEADRPAWMTGWQVVREDRAGMVHFHLLQRLPG